MIRIVLLLALVACSNSGDERAKAAIRHYGCGTCHDIPRLGGANGHVGPPLDNLATREYLAGRLTNTRDHLIEWIQHPQAIEPGTVMPEMGVTDRDAEDIAAFLSPP